MLAAGSLAAGDLVVDFGCGSGNLTLPLAARFPVLEVVGVDVKREAVDLLRSRAHAANLTNLRAWHGGIEDYSSAGLDFQLAIGLHVCGEASDRIVRLAVERQRPWAISPCCIGAVNNEGHVQGAWAEIPLHAGEEFVLEKIETGDCFIRFKGSSVPLFGAAQITPEGRLGPALVTFDEGSGYSLKRRRSKVVVEERLEIVESIPVLREVLHGAPGATEQVLPAGLVLLRRNLPKLRRPLSQWLSSQLTEESYVDLASVADTGADHKLFEGVFQRAKTVVTMDRGMWAVERGYKVEHLRIGGMGSYAKDDLLTGSVL
mmetsp:Transcript_82542/g.267382  ORF Transcript_82542/g.267382 Transcript_82542/m.267382 type:complete len:317 (-) Transcript_82542:439-1389(-)